jgi:PPOX class probable F420-dependent enzyme
MQWIAIFTSVDEQGKPHAVPVWFTYDDGKLHVQTDRNSVKVRNIQSNPYVAMAICNMRDEAVCIHGKAHLVSDEKDFKRLTHAHIDKYNRLHNIANNTDGVEYIKLDAQGCDSMGIPLFDSRVRCIIEVRPKKTLFW